MSGAGSPARSHSGRNRSSSGLRVRASFGSWLERLAQLDAAGASAPGDRPERLDVQHLVVIGVRPGMTHPFVRRHRCEVKQRLLDRRGRQLLVQDAFARAPPVHADSVQRSASPRRGHLEWPGLLVEQVMPPEGGGVAEHRARAGVQHRRPQVALNAGREVANGIYPGVHLVKVATGRPADDHHVVNPDRDQLPPGHSPRLPSASRWTLALQLRICQVHRQSPGMGARIASCRVTEQDAELQQMSYASSVRRGSITVIVAGSGRRR